MVNLALLKAVHVSPLCRVYQIIPDCTITIFLSQNKKVLLRERKTYCPLCSKYSLCCPNWVTPPARVPPKPGYPPARPGYPPGQGTPRPGYPPARVPPSQGTPLARVPPWPGYPPGQGTPPSRVPPPAGPGRVPPPAAPWYSGKCCKALWDTGTPPGVDRQTK